VYFWWPKKIVETNPDLLVCNSACQNYEQCQSGFCSSDGFCRNKECPNEANCQCNTNKTVTVKDFVENFRDGKIDDFWVWNDGGNTASSQSVDYIKEEMLLTAAGGTSQWTSDNSAPTLSFNTKNNFSLEVEFDFDPRFDFQHAGIGVMDKNSGDWIRISRCYDTHSLQNEYDQPNSLYLMEKQEKGVQKYNHVNFYDTKVYLRMKRMTGKITVEYSRDGNAWSTLGMAENENLADEVEVYLFVYSTNPNPVSVAFKNIVYNIID